MKNRKKASGVGRFLIRLLLLAAGLCIGLTASVYLWLAKTHYTPVNIVAGGAGVSVSAPAAGAARNEIGRIPVYVHPDFPIEKVGKKDWQVDNYLIIGIDSRGEEIARTDTMMVLSVDRRHGAIKLTSLMRDIEAELPGREGERDKLNAAYAFGGVGLLINTVNSLFDLDIQMFMQVDFWSATKIVDTMGGIAIPVSAEEVSAVNDVMGEMNSLMGLDPDADLLTEAGEQQLNGRQTIAWARVRAVGSDHARTGRQRYVVTAILRKFSQLSLPRKLKAATAVLEEMQTNMRPIHLMQMGFGAMFAMRRMMDYKVPADESMYTTDASNWNIVINRALQVPALHQFIYQQIPE